MKYENYLLTMGKIFQVKVHKLITKQSLTTSSVLFFIMRSITAMLLCVTWKCQPVAPTVLVYNIAALCPTRSVSNGGGNKHAAAGPPGCRPSRMDEETLLYKYQQHCKDTKINNFQWQRTYELSTLISQIIIYIYLFTLENFPYNAGTFINLCRLSQQKPRYWYLVWLGISDQFPIKNKYSHS